MTENIHTTQNNTDRHCQTIISHVKRMSNSRLPAKALETLVSGTRSRGRQSRRWIDTYSKEEVIYNRQQSVSKAESNGRNLSIQPHILTTYEWRWTGQRRKKIKRKRRYSKARFPLPELTGLKKCTRVDGQSTRVHFLHPSTRASKNAPEFTGRQLGPWTRAVNSGSGNRA